MLVGAERVERIRAVFEGALDAGPHLFLAQPAEKGEKGEKGEEGEEGEEGEGEKGEKSEEGEKRRRGEVGSVPRKLPAVLMHLWMMDDE